MQITSTNSVGLSIAVAAKKSTPPTQRIMSTPCLLALSIIHSSYYSNSKTQTCRLQTSCRLRILVSKHRFTWKESMIKGLVGANLGKCRDEKHRESCKNILTLSYHKISLLNLPKIKFSAIWLTQWHCYIFSRYLHHYTENYQYWQPPCHHYGHQCMRIVWWDCVNGTPNVSPFWHLRHTDSEMIIIDIHSFNTENRFA